MDISTDDFAVFEPTMAYCFESLPPSCGSNLQASTSCRPKTVRSHGGDFLRQACKARSVAVKPGQVPHVPKFAYIDVPVGAHHGTELSCSHPTCAASGRRFRYCAVCDRAVAKRNFTVRHRHECQNDSSYSQENHSCTTPSMVSGAASNSPLDVTSEEVRCPSPTSEMSVPTMITIDDSKTQDVCLNAREAEFIKMIRCRPVIDDKIKLLEWQQALLSFAVQETSKSELAFDTNLDIVVDDSDNLSVASFDTDDEHLDEDLEFTSLDNVFDFARLLRS